jgi:hypothetical protein
MCSKTGLEWLKNIDELYPKFIDTKNDVPEELKICVNQKIEENEPKDDLNIALDILENKSENINSGKKWTDVEEKKLLSSIKTKKIKEIASEHNRTEGGIRSRLKHIACNMYKNSDMMDSDIEKICRDTKINKDILIKTLEHQNMYNKKKDITETKDSDVEEEIEEFDIVDMEEKPKKKVITKVIVKKKM